MTPDYPRQTKTAERHTSCNYNTKKTLKEIHQVPSRRHWTCPITRLCDSVPSDETHVTWIIPSPATSQHTRDLMPLLKNLINQTRTTHHPANATSKTSSSAKNDPLSVSPLSDWDSNLPKFDNELTHNRKVRPLLIQTQNNTSISM